MSTDTKIAMLDVVALKKDSAGSEPGIVLTAGQQGTIVEDFGGGRYLVEFADKFGVTIDLHGCTDNDLTLVWRAATGKYVATNDELVAA